MRIGINGYEAVIPRLGYDRVTNLPIRVGSSEYVFELLKELYWSNKTNKTYYIYLPCPPSSDLPDENDNWHYVVVPKKSLWTIFSLSKELLFNKVKLDVFFSPTHYLPAYCPYPSVISVMDLSYLHFPQLFKAKDLWQLRLWTKFSVAKAKKVITISCASKNDIIKHYGVETNKIAVTYPGIKLKNQNSLFDRKLAQSKQIKMTNQNSKFLEEKYHISDNYILFVGTIQPRKNIVRLIEAFSKLKNHFSNENLLKANNSKIKMTNHFSQENSLEASNLKLVIVGRKGWLYEEIYEAPQKFGVANDVVFLDTVTEEELPVFYKNAKVFILPSLYEGFGLPILEAMQNGCPVITSNVSSMPEAGGDAAIYVNPEDVNDIAEKITRVLSDEKLREDMISKGYQQVKQFSWEKTARETLKVLKEVGGEK